MADKKMVRMTFPDTGETADVPADRVSFYAKQGAKRAKGLGEKALDTLPTIGGMVGGIGGGILGTPADLVTGPLGTAGGAVLGAGLGGGAGEGIRRLGYQALGLGEPDQMNPAAAIGQQAGTQAAYEAVGIPLGMGARLAGKGLMRAALKATPEAAQTAIREGIVATKAGGAKLGRLLGQAGQRTAAVASRVSGRFDANQLASDVFNSVAKSGLPGDIVDRDLASDLSHAFVSENPRPLTGKALHLVKQRAEDIAGPLYEKAAQAKYGGAPLTGDEALRLKWHQALADHARDALEQATQYVKPDGSMGSLYSEHNAVTRGLIEVGRSLNPAAKREAQALSQVAIRGIAPTAGAALGAMSGGGGYAEHTARAGLGAAAGLAVTSPQALSQMALMLSHPALSAVLGQAPRLIGAAGQE